MRSAERELARRGIPCFATPGRERAEGHPFYTWMLNGMALYRSLLPDYPLLAGRLPPLGRVCFETFPHAIACALAGCRVRGSNKRSDRRAVLEAAGVPTGMLGSLDWIDAALCALAAGHLVQDSFQALGEKEEEDGLIILPDPTRRPGSASTGGG